MTKGIQMPDNSFGTDDKGAQGGTGGKTGTPTDQTPDQPFLKIGEREFKSPDDVVTKITAADEHIKRLEEEHRQTEAKLAEALELAATLKEKTEQALSVKEMIEGLKGGNVQQQESGTPAISTEDIAAKVLESLDERTQKQKQLDNFKAAMAAAKESLGDNFKESIGNKAKELGMSIADVDALAKRSPKAFAQLMLPETKSDGSPTSTVFQPEPQKPAERKQFTSLSFKERKAYIHALAERLTN